MNKLDKFMNAFIDLRDNGSWSKQNIIDLYYDLLPDFQHKETGKYLDQRM